VNLDDRIFISERGISKARLIHIRHHCELVDDGMLLLGTKPNILPQYICVGDTLSLVPKAIPSND
jgi:hypothetical protein